MNTNDLFKTSRSAKKINESMEKIFGKKINLESFSLDQLQDARNKIRTQLSQQRSSSGFNENIENEAYTQAQWMLDAVNAEITQREEFIVDDIEKELDEEPQDPSEGYDRNEYDDEGDMAKTQLHVIDSAAEELRALLDDDENLPEWVQKKINLAKDYIDTARDYMVATDKKEMESNDSFRENKELEMTKLRESEIDEASAIVTANSMVDRLGRWIEELSGMENETMLELGDSIRDEMGQEQSRQFIEAVAPTIQSALETLKAARESVSGAVRNLATGESPDAMLGAPEEPGMDDMDMTEPDAMNTGDVEIGPEEPADDFDAAEPSAGGSSSAGRERRESIDFQNRLLKALAG